MKNKEYIKQQVEDTFKVLDTIHKADVNHFFKHKVLQKIQAEKVVKQTTFSWLTPKLQLATLGLVLLLNASAIFYSFTSSETNESSDIETFAQEYSLQSNSNFILN